MANSQAKTGAVAAKAGAPTDGQTATVGADKAAEGAGKVDVVGDAPADAPETDEKGPKEATKVVEKAADAIKTVVKEAEKAEKPKNLKKVKILRSHPDFAYHPGEEGELPAEKATQLIEGGFAEALTK